MRLFLASFGLAAGALVSAAAAAQQPVAATSQSASQLTVQRIFASREFASEAPPAINWSRDGTSYVELRPATGGGTDVIRVDAVTGRPTVLASGSGLVGEDGKPMDVEELTLSPDETKALVFHNSVRVWRQNTRGVYHVLDLASHKVTALSRRPGLQMFAKFSPDGRQIAFVRDNDLWVTDLASATEQQVTTDGSETIINGTTDWVYEEELGLRDAFRWSPDGEHLAFWRFDQSEIPVFPLVNELTVYPQVVGLRYPKAGAPNSKVRVGVVHLLLTGAERTTWLDVGEGNDQYLARMEWLGRDSVVVQRLPRSQTSLDLLMVSSSSGKGRTIFTERDSGFVDVGDGDLHWMNGGREFLWFSDRTGWHQLFLYDRAGRVVRQITSDGMDVLDIEAVDERRGEVYVTAAAPTPMERNVYRCVLAAPKGKAVEPCQRITREAGSHALTVAPASASVAGAKSGGAGTTRFAVDFHSTLNLPVTATLYELSTMTARRTLADNAEIKRRVAALDISPAQFLRVPMPDGTQLDAWRIVPPGFDSTRKYPVLMFVYGGPSSPTVTNEWGGSTYLWHQMLAQRGYVVISADNRGAAWRGRDFRKVQVLRLGMPESQDQLDVARWLGRQSWADATRIGIWGWSYGGFMTALTAARGGDLFKAALCVAPVTDWRLYDTIYTERYMRTPRENPEGYRLSSAQTYVEGLHARFLLVHGTGDDNVHLQNSLQLANRLEGAGKVFSMLLYPNRTHSLSEGGVTAQLRESFTRFILDNL